MSLLHGHSDRHKRESGHRIYGVVVGIVTNNKDPDGKYRVKVRFPWLPNGDESGSSSEESDWCRVATFMAGNGRGMFCLPEVSDEVLVAFEHGEISHPYIIGALWNKNDVATGDNKGGKNNSRAFKSRSGHILEFFDDKENKAEKITVKSAAGAKIIIDDSDGAKKIQIYDDSGNNYVLIDSTNKEITVRSAKNITIKADDTITLQAKSIALKSDKDTAMQSGTTFDLKAGSTGSFKTSGTMTVQAGGDMTIKGGPNVNIN